MGGGSRFGFVFRVLPVLIQAVKQRLAVLERIIVSVDGIFNILLGFLILGFSCSRCQFQGSSVSASLGMASNFVYYFIKEQE